jgi:hypothetical protein
MNTRSPGVCLAATAFMLGTLGFSAIDAQTSDGNPRRTTRRGYFEVGRMALDLGELNDVLVPAGYPKMGQEFLTLGGAGFGEHGRVLIGGEGTALLGRTRSTTNGSYSLAMSGGYGLFRVGYKAFSAQSVDVFPTLGLGGGALQLDIRGRSSSTFGDILASPGRSSRLTTGSVMLGVGVDMHYRIRAGKQRAGDDGGVLMGVSTGYLFSTGSGEWTLDDINSVAGGPSTSFEGFYVRLSFGGWGRKGGN